MSINLTNSVDLIVNSLSLIRGNNVEDINDIFLSKDEAISGIVGLPISTLDTLEKIGLSIDNDPNFFANNQASLNQKANISFVTGELLLKKDILSYNTEKDIITNNFNNYETITTNNGKLLLKTDVAAFNTQNVATNTKFNLYETIANNNIKNSLQYSKVEVDTIFTNLIDAAPASLNTLNELAAALNDDDNYAATTLALINNKLNIADIYSNGVIAGVDYPLVRYDYVSDRNNSGVFINGNVTIASKLKVDYDLECGDLTCSTIYGGAIAQINNAIDTRTASKAEQASTYTKTEANTLLDAKANQSTTYTKTETAELQALKQRLITQSASGFPLLRSDGKMYTFIASAHTQVGIHFDTITDEQGASSTTNHRFSIDLKQATIDMINAGEPNFVAELPLRKTLNVNTGIITLSMDTYNPYHIAINVAVNGSINTQSGIYNAAVSKQGDNSSYTITITTHYIGSH